MSCSSYNVFYVDPQSYGNLEKYDRGVIEHAIDFNVHYICNVKIADTSWINGRVVKKVFRYSDYSFLPIKVSSYVCSLVSLLFYFVRVRPNAVHVQWYKFLPFDIAVYGLMKLLFPKSVFIFTAHNNQPHKKNVFDGLLQGLLYRVFDHFVVHEESASRYLQKIYGVDQEKITKIKHGLIPFLKKGEVARDIYKVFSSTEKLFISVGAINQYKGVCDLVEAWSESRVSRSEGVSLLIAGKFSHDMIFLKEKIDALNNVFYIDRFLSEAELEFMSSNCCAAFLTYRRISQSGVLLSLLGHKCPVIVNDVGGLGEPFNYANVGMCLNAEESLSEFLNKLEFNCDSLAEIRNDDLLWEKIYEEYSWLKISRRTNGLYKRLIAGC